MQLARSGIARDPRGFGRGPDWHLATFEARPALGGDLKLFATTFLAGFIFISVLLA
jgi:hypothetical protein